MTTLTFRCLTLLRSGGISLFTRDVHPEHERKLRLEPGGGLVLKRIVLSTILVFFVSIGLSFGQTSSFTADKTELCKLGNVEFTDTSVGASSWLWDFGNSNAEFGSGPYSASYPRPGVYTVKLTINGGGSPALESEKQIRVYPEPNPKFDAVQGCEPYNVNLTASAVPVSVDAFTIGVGADQRNVGAITGGNAVKFIWNFFGKIDFDESKPGVQSDGTVETTTPQLVWSNVLPDGVAGVGAGAYDLMLTVEDDNGCSKVLFVQNAIIVNPKPTADFSYTKENSCGIGKVTFSVNGTIASGSVNGYSWDVGNDGSIEGTSQEYLHTFTATGNYPVSVFVTSDQNCSSDPVVKNVLFNSDNAIDFEVDGDCAGHPITFTDRSTEANVVSRQWDFDYHDGDNDIEATTKVATHAYTAPGDYTIRLKVQFNDGCEMETTKEITVYATTVDFSFDLSSSCAPNYAVDFTSNVVLGNPAGSVTSHEWDFNGDDIVDSTEENPSFNFNASGLYTVKLTVDNGEGCHYTVSHDVNLINAEVLIRSYVGAEERNTGCIPETFKFVSENNNGADPIVSYDWRIFDDNNVELTNSTLSEPTYEFTNHGTYKVTLDVVTQNGCSLSDEHSINVGIKQPLNVAYSSSSCFSSEVDFTASVTTATDYLVWNFNEGGDEIQNLTDTDVSVTRQFDYPNIGSGFKANVVAYDNGCPSDPFSINDITVNGPQAIFSVSNSAQCDVPAVVGFTNNSAGLDGTTTYEWDFNGDGTVDSTDEDPSYTYTTPGDYVVKLKVTNSSTGCSDETTRNVYVTSGSVALNPTLGPEGAVSCVNDPCSFLGDGMQVDFSVSSNFSAGTYLWNYGDGNTSTGKKPSHTYSEPGHYQIVLTVTEEHGCDYQTAPLSVYIRGPKVDFDNVPTVICKGTEVQFTNKTTKESFDPANEINYVYDWDFGDDTPHSSEENPKHTYTKDGTFAVKLTVTDENGCVNSKTIVNSVAVPKLQAGINPSKNIFCINEDINLSDGSTIKLEGAQGAIVRHDWDLDGDGTYEITDGTSNQIVNYAAVGVYTVNHRVFNDVGCSDETSKTITIVDGTGEFTIDGFDFASLDLGCAPAIASFEPKDPDLVVASYLWDFGDGETSAAREPNHFFKLPGTYTVRLTETLTGGCTRSTTKQVIVDGAFGNFSYEENPECAPNTRRFFARDLSGVDHITWDFGDGNKTEMDITTETEVEVTHTYTTWGTRLPILILHNPTCGDYSYYYGEEHRINTSVDPFAEFSYEAVADGKTCEELEFQFFDESTIADPRYGIATWEWSFGDGATSTEQNPKHRYTSAGTFSVTLKVTNGFITGGCPSEITKQIVVDPLPVINTLPAAQNVCSTDKSSPMNISSSLPGTTYEWVATIPSGIVSVLKDGGGNVIETKNEGDQIQGTATVIPGRFFENITNAPITVEYIITPYGPGTTQCEGETFTAEVVVQPTPTVTSDAWISVCSGEDIDYTIESGVDNVTFAWSRGAITGGSGSLGATASGNSSTINEILTNTINPVSDDSITVEYSIIPTGPTGCVGHAFTLTVAVYPVPQITSTLAKEICSGERINLPLTSNVPGVTFYYSKPSGAQVTGGVTGMSGRSKPGNGNKINNRLVNPTVTDQTVTYHVIPVYKGCEGTPQDIVITVHPVPVVASSLSERICADITGSATSSLALTTDPVMVGVTYKYNAPTEDVGLVGGTARASFSDLDITDNFTNGTNNILTATYAVIPKAPLLLGGCEGSAVNVKVNVDPFPHITSSLSESSCSGNFSYVITSDVAGSTFAWTRNNVAGIAETASNGTNQNINETLTNETTSPIVVPYTLTVTGPNGCTGETKTLNVTVNPKGQVNSIIDKEVCNGVTINEIAFSTLNDNTETTTYSWTNNNTSIGLGASGTGNIGAFVSQNNGSAPIVATIIVTPSYGGCEGDSKSFTITVNPTPKVNSVSTVTICSGDELNYVPTSLTAGTVFNWTAENTVGTVTGFETNGSGDIVATLTNAGETDGTVVYTITPTGPADTDCPGIPFYLEVSILNCQPEIGVAKQLVSTKDNGDGTFDVLFNIRVQNYGNVELDNIQVTENLETVFGANNYEVLELSSTSFDVLTSFNGNSNKNLLNNAGTRNKLKPEASTGIRLKVRVKSAGTYHNKVTASSTTGGVTDESEDGSDPDPDGDEEPGNNSTLTQVVLEQGALMVSAGTDAKICDGTYYIHDATASNYKSLHWSTNGDGEFSQDDILNPIYTPKGNDLGSSVVLTLTATAFDNSTKQSTVTLEVGNLSAKVTAHSNVSCYDGSDGSITVSAEGGIGTVSYRLNTSGSSNSIGVFNNLSAGEYGIIVSDESGCTYTVSFDIDESAVLVADIVDVVDVNCNGGSEGAATVIVSGGTAPYSYSWDTTPVQTDARVTNLSEGTYEVTVTDANGCTIKKSVSITEPTELLVATGSIIDASCNGSSDGSIAINVSGGEQPYSYVWNNGQAVEDAVNLSAGTYSVKVTDANGCSKELNGLVVNEPAAVSLSATIIQEASCNQAVGVVELTASDNSAVTIDGVSITPVLSGSTHTFTGLKAGKYTARSGGSCEAVANFVIVNEDSNLNATVDFAALNCNGDVTDVTVTVTGGLSPYNYSLNGAAAVASNVFTDLSAGEYNVLVTDANSCTYTVSFDIDEQAVLVADIVDVVDVNCNGGSEGAATVVVSGGTAPYSFSWDTAPVQTSSRATNLSEGTFEVTVTDANGCTIKKSVSITEPTELLVIAGSITDASCNGSSDGSIAINVSGGEQPYSYVWNNGQAVEDAVNLSAGTYSVKVTDSNGCSKELNGLVVNEPAAVSLSAVIKKEASCNQPVGVVELTASDNSVVTIDGVTIAPVVSGSTYTFTGLKAGKYTARSGGSCEAVVNFVIVNEDSNLNAIVDFAALNCNRDVTDVTVTVTGGLAPYSYSLNGAAVVVSNVFTDLAAGEYNVLVTDANDCTYTVSFDIEEPSAVTLQLVSQSNVICKGSSTGTARVIASGGIVGVGYTYSIFSEPSGSTASISGNMITDMKAGDYVIKVADANGCQAELSIRITETLVALAATANVESEIECDGSKTAVAKVSPTGGDEPYNYRWTNSSGELAATTQIASGLTADTYSVEVVDANGCSVTVNDIVIEKRVCCPIAQDDNVTTPEDTDLSGNVLDNDTDPNGLSLNITKFEIGGISYTAGQKADVSGIGSIQINNDGSFSFDPADNYYGDVPDIVYTVSNGTESSTAYLNITVTPVNDTPIAHGDSKTTAEDSSAGGDLSVNDVKSGDGGNVWSIKDEPLHGTVILELDGSYIYTPDADYVGSDSFTYKLCDTDGSCDEGTVNVTVTSVNDDPIAVDDVTTTPEDQSVSIDVLSNDNFGGDGPSTSSIVIVTNASHGVATVNDNGTSNDPTDDTI
ncbi:PKD domain-containing protein, partial [Puteibacter caeruleilacunae]